MNVLIAGCGDVGVALGIELVDAGHRVYGLRRRAELIPPPIEPLAADVGNRATLVGLPDHIDAVYYVAAADERTRAGYRRTYVDGQANLLGALASSPRLWVFVSSTAVYGQTGGEWVDETTPVDPAGFRGETLVEAEAIAVGAGASAVVVRLAGIYGPGRTRLLDAVRRGEARCRSDPPLYSNRIHRDDCAGALAHLGSIEQPADLYVAVDNLPAPLCEVQGWLAGEVGAPAPTDDPDLDPNRANKRCRNDRLRASGYDLRYRTYQEGYRALIDPRRDGPKGRS